MCPCVTRNIENRVTKWQSDWVTEWPSDWVTGWQEASQTIDRMVHLLHFLIIDYCKPFAGLCLTPIRSKNAVCHKLWHFVNFCKVMATFTKMRWLGVWGICWYKVEDNSIVFIHILCSLAFPPHLILCKSFGTTINFHFWSLQHLNCTVCLGENTKINVESFGI